MDGESNTYPDKHSPSHPSVTLHWSFLLPQNPTPMRHLLAVNIGSSSLKFSLYPISGMGAQAQLGPVQISGQY